MSASSSSHDYTISRVKVHFPCKAYPSQVAMMNQIIRGLQRGQNALLESPTGSGKSLALLCAALAWQRHEAEKAREYNTAVDQGIIQPEYVLVNENEEEVDEANIKDAPVDGGAGFFPSDVANDLDDFLDTADGNSSPPAKKPRPDEKSKRVPPPMSYTRKVKRKTVPKIYFGTRTHKQITQIIRELNKTTYRDVPMTILGSRDHTCIHPVVSRMKNRNEGCKELMDRRVGSGCSYHTNVKNKLNSHCAVNTYRGGRKDAWDLEDLVKVGKKVRACPYFATRELKAKAQIVFCPYNYLVEPTIRKSMEIYLKGQVLILDEAHNIEDSARSAASWQVTQDEIRMAMQDLEKVAAAEVVTSAEAHRELALVCSQLSSWIDTFSGDLSDYRDFNSAAKIWTGTEIVALFEVHGIGHTRYAAMLQHMNLVVTEWQQASSGEDGAGEDSNKDDTPKLNPNTISLLEGFFLMLSNLYMHDMRHRDDYRVAITKTHVRNTEKKGSNNSLGSWLGKSKGTPHRQGGGGSNFRLTYTINFWCLNPAVSFVELKETVHSIILTSGTLSPMASFSSELDVRFPLQLEASHVIDKRQVWISTLSRGPGGHSLNATFRNVESYAFQDELGQLAASVCEHVPHGVLFFLPSYSMLNKLSERWRETGLWERLCRRKVVITEPRFSDEFEASIRHFYDVIKVTEKGPNAEGTDGALFMAVCRGKVSEGLDFADNNARAVVCVGIPFPNVKDIQVDLKKRYNDGRRLENRKAEDMATALLSGNEWYEIQAFRALNQALGRCIRHKQDWGAILMVDDRYQRNNRYIGSLSKWVRSGVTHYSYFDQMIGSLTQFTKQMQEMQLEEPVASLDPGSNAATATNPNIPSEKIKLEPQRPKMEAGSSQKSITNMLKAKAEHSPAFMKPDVKPMEGLPNSPVSQIDNVKPKAAVTTVVPDSDDDDPAAQDSATFSFAPVISSTLAHGDTSKRGPETKDTPSSYTPNMAKSRKETKVVRTKIVAKKQPVIQYLNVSDDDDDIFQ